MGPVSIMSSNIMFWSYFPSLNNPLIRRTAHKAWEANESDRTQESHESPQFTSLLRKAANNLWGRDCLVDLPEGCVANIRDSYTLMHHPF